jgi:hypothetical protein
MRKIFRTVQINLKLREADILIGQGKSVREAVRVLEVIAPNSLPLSP